MTDWHYPMPRRNSRQQAHGHVTVLASWVWSNSWSIRGLAAGSWSSHLPLFPSTFHKLGADLFMRKRKCDVPSCHYGPLLPSVISDRTSLSVSDMSMMTAGHYTNNWGRPWTVTTCHDQMITGRILCCDTVNSIQFEAFIIWISV